jgi:hypothetical protein
VPLSKKEEKAERNRIWRNRMAAEQFRRQGGIVSTVAEVGPNGPGQNFSGGGWHW